MKKQVTWLDLADGRFHCPHCDYDTPLINSMAAHLRKRHGEAWVITQVLIAPQTAVLPLADTPKDID